MSDIPGPPPGGRLPGVGGFRPGDRVTVVDGTFAGMTGEILNSGPLVSYAMVRVELSIFGRNVPVELEACQIRHA